MVGLANADLPRRRRVIAWNRIPALNMRVGGQCPIKARSMADLAGTKRRESGCLADRSCKGTTWVHAFAAAMGVGVALEKGASARAGLDHSQQRSASERGAGRFVAPKVSAQA